MTEDTRDRHTGGGANVERVPSVSPSRQVSIEERRRLVAESLRIGNPGNNARNLPTDADPRHECQIELKVVDIRAYEHNPRRANNNKFAEIKASIRATGIRNPLTVTRRPGETHFIVEAGGNTRLLAIQQLWTETRESRFERLSVLFRPWRSESHVLTAHLIENEQRAEMTFWDKANGVLALKRQLEAEKGRALSMRQLEEELNALGMAASITTLTYYLFSIERLRTIGEAVSTLSRLDVRQIQPRLNLMKRYAQTHAGIAEAQFYAAIIEPVLRRVADEYRRTERFGAVDLCERCEEALAAHLSEPPLQLRRALDALARAPQPSSDALREEVALNSSAAPAAARQMAATQGVSSGNTPNRQIDPVRSGMGSAPALPSHPREAVSDTHQLVRRVQAFAGLTGTSDALRIDAGSVRGFVMTQPPGEDESYALRRAWWLLALVAGQCGGSAVAGQTPTTVTAFAEGSSEASLIAWLLDPTNPAAAAFWEIGALVRGIAPIDRPAQSRDDHQPGQRP